MATTTPSKVAGSQPAGVHTGSIVVADISATATLSAADVLELLKVPAGARVASLSITPNSAVGTVAVSIGDGDDPDRFLTSSNLTAETTVYATNGLGYQYDISDTAVVRYDTIDATIISGSITAGGAIRISATIVPAE